MIDEKTFAAPLKPDLDYYDATPTIEQCLELVKDHAQRLHDLEEMFATQLSINQQLLGNMQSLLQRLPENDKPTGLILPDRLN